MCLGLARRQSFLGGSKPQVAALQEEEKHVGWNHGRHGWRTGGQGE
jgi:hypothetical protein